MFDSLTERFDKQFVPNTNKGTLRKELYQRFIAESATEDEIEDFLLKRRLLVKEGQEIRAFVAGVLKYSMRAIFEAWEVPD